MSTWENWSWTDLGEFNHQRMHMGTTSALVHVVVGALIHVLTFSDS